MAGARARAARARVPGEALSGPYAFAEDAGSERARLGAVERALDPITIAALLDAGAGPGMRCWEAGAGRGSIATWLSHTAGGGGEVIATDVDGRWYEGAVDLVLHDVVADPPPAGDLDLIHARLLLEHVPEPARVLRRLAAALRPGGVLVVEDAAGLRFGARPPAPALTGLARPWERAGRAVGWDATYGAALARHMAAAGLEGVHGRARRLVAPGGDAWRHVRAGIERLRGEIAAAGAAEAHVDAALGCLSDPATLVIGAPVVTVAGRRGR